MRSDENAIWTNFPQDLRRNVCENRSFSRLITISVIIIVVCGRWKFEPTQTPESYNYLRDNESNM
jgi:hypothetical protein